MKTKKLFAGVLILLALLGVGLLDCCGIPSGRRSQHRQSRRIAPIYNGKWIRVCSVIFLPRIMMCRTAG